MRSGEPVCQASDDQRRSNLIVRVADIYARRHSPHWKTIQDVAPAELVAIILRDAEKIVDKVVLPLIAETDLALHIEIMKLAEELIDAGHPEAAGYLAGWLMSHPKPCGAVWTVLDETVSCQLPEDHEGWHKGLGQAWSRWLGET